MVPLSRQAVEILRTIKEHTGVGKYLFPGLRTKDRPISDTAITAALRNLGFTKVEIVGHGFRVMASTLRNEQGYNPEG
jgi:integrase